MARNEAVGKAVYSTEVDPSGLEKGLRDGEAAIRGSGERAEAEATSRASRAAQKLAGIGKAGMVALSGAAVGVSVALLGRMQELEGATADFRRETGATAEEAKRAGEAINAMAGDNLQPIEEIGETLTKVTTDLGLSGDEAERTTAKFLKFAQATDQEASAAVLDFDDILDSWGLTAEDAAGIMDQLVASHERFGGSIEGNQAALASMAPALRAMNLTVDDGVGLLNLFAASGLDAAAAQRGLNGAVTRLPKGEDLRTFLDRLSSIEDPTKRAAEAVKVFGTQAGVKLANALGPGSGALADYIITAEEVPGATEKAAEASLTLVDRLTKGFSGFVSGTVELLGPAGPLLTAVGALAPVLAPALGKAVSGTASLVAGPLKALGEGMGEAIGAALGPKIAAALGTQMATGALSLGALTAAGLVLTIPATVAIVAMQANPELTKPENLVRAFSGAGGLPVPIQPYMSEDEAKKAAAASQYQLIRAFEGADFADALQAVGGFDLWAGLGIKWSDFERQLKSRMERTGETIAEAIADWGTYTVPAVQDLWRPLLPAVEAGGKALGQATVEGFMTEWRRLGDEARRTGDYGALGEFLVANRDLVVEHWNELPFWAQKALRASHIGLNAALAADRKIWERYTQPPPPPPEPSYDGVARHARRASLAAWNGVRDTYNAEVDRFIEEQRQAWEDAGTGFAFDLAGGFQKGVKGSRSTLQEAILGIRDMLDFDWDAEAGYAMGEQFMDSVRRGLQSGEPEIVQQAKEATLGALTAMERSGRDGPKAANRIGNLLAELYGRGIEGGELEARLRAEGVSLAALEGIARKAGWRHAGGAAGGAWVQGVEDMSPEALEAALTLNRKGLEGVARKAGWRPGGRQNAREFIQGLLGEKDEAKGAGGDLAGAGRKGAESVNFKQSGRKSASAWVTGFEEILGSPSTQQRFSDAAYGATGPVRGQSPPTVGPLRDIGRWGANVGRAWHDSFIAGLAVADREVDTATAAMRRAAAEPVTVGVVVEQPDPVVVRPPDPVRVAVVDPDPIHVRATTPRPVEVGATAPDPVKVRVAKPDPVKVRVKAPDRVNVPVNQPGPVKVRVKADPVKVDARPTRVTITADRVKTVADPVTVSARPIRIQATATPVEVAARPVRVRTTSDPLSLTARPVRVRTSADPLAVAAAPVRVRVSAETSGMAAWTRRLGALLEAGTRGARDVGRAWRNAFMSGATVTDRDIRTVNARARMLTASARAGMLRSGAVRLDTSSTRTVRFEATGAIRVDLTERGARALRAAGYSGADIRELTTGPALDRFNEAMERHARLGSVTYARADG